MILGDIDSTQIPQEESIDAPIVPVQSEQPKPQSIPNKNVIDVYGNQETKTRLDTQYLQPKDEETGWVDNFWSSAEKTFYNETSFGSNYTVNTAVEGNYNALKDKGLLPEGVENQSILPEGLQNIADIAGASMSFGLSTGDVRGLSGSVADVNHYDSYDRYLDYIKAHPEYVQKMQQEHPELGVKTYTEIQDTILGKFSEVARQQAAISADATNLGVIGQVFGSMAGLTATPIGAVSVLTPVGRASSVMTTFAKWAGIGALTALGEQAVDKPSEIAVRELQGEDISTMQVATEVATNVGASAALSGVLGAIGTKLGSLLKKSPEALTATDKTNITNLKDAKNIIEETNSIFNDKPDNINPIDNETAVNQVFTDFTQNKLTDVNKLTSSLDDPNKVKIEIPPTIEELKASNTPEATKVAYQNLKTSLETQDQVLKIKDELGIEHTYSLKNTLKDIDEDAKTHELLTKCLTTGEVNAD